MILLAVACLFTSCDKNNNGDEDPKPDDISYFIGSIQDLKSKIANISKDVASADIPVIINFVDKAKLEISNPDFNSLLSELKDILNNRNVSFNVNNALLAPAEEQMFLDAEKFTILNDLWSIGLHFGFSAKGYMFWISADIQASTEQKKVLGILGANRYEITRAEDFGEACREVENLAKSEIVNVIVNTNIVIDADTLPQIRRILNNPNIKLFVEDGGQISTVVTKHPSRSEIIDCLEGYHGGKPVQILLDHENIRDEDGKPVKPPGKRPAIVFSNKSFHLVKTANTPNKTDHVAEIRNRQTGEFDTPVVTCFADGFSSMKPVDGDKAISSDVDEINFDHSLPILMASTYVAGNTEIQKSTSIYPETEYFRPSLFIYPIIKTNVVNVYLSTDPKYIGRAIYDSKNDYSEYIYGDNFIHVGFDAFWQEHYTVLAIFGLHYRGEGTKIIIKNKGLKLNFITYRDGLSGFYNTEHISGIDIRPHAFIVSEYLSYWNVFLEETNVKNITYGSFDMYEGEPPFNINAEVQMWDQVDLSKTQAETYWSQ